MFCDSDFRIDRHEVARVKSDVDLGGGHKKVVEYSQQENGGGMKIEWGCGKVS